jgi:hypothetical protein
LRKIFRVNLAATCLALSTSRWNYASAATTPGW